MRGRLPCRGIQQLQHTAWHGWWGLDRTCRDESREMSMLDASKDMNYTKQTLITQRIDGYQHKLWILWFNKMLRSCANNLFPMFFKTTPLLPPTLSFPRLPLNELQTPPSHRGLAPTQQSPLVPLAASPACSASPWPLPHLYPAILHPGQQVMTGTNAQPCSIHLRHQHQWPLQAPPTAAPKHSRHTRTICQCNSDSSHLKPAARGETGSTMMLVESLARHLQLGDMKPHFPSKQL